MSSTQNRGVEVPGNTAVEKAELASRVIGAILQDDPASAIRMRVPEASAAHITELRLAPQRLVGFQSGEGSFDVVYVRCSIKASLSDEIATRVVEACEALVREHLGQILAESTEAAEV